MRSGRAACFRAAGRLTRKLRPWPSCSSAGQSRGRAACTQLGAPRLPRGSPGGKRSLGCERLLVTSRQEFLIPTRFQGSSIYRYLYVFMERIGGLLTTRGSHTWCSPRRCTHLTRAPCWQTHSFIATPIHPSSETFRWFGYNLCRPGLYTTADEESKI